jgi:hypothetical protein
MLVMNAILLGVAALGTLAAMAVSPMARTSLLESSHLDRGWMTHTTQVDPQTGETTEIDSIGFLD